MATGGLQRGRLKIGDEWNAIVLLARTQTSPLKAVAELVENSIDARAKQIAIVRGRHQGKIYLTITDDGEGVRTNEDGLPDFRYVATHICDSMKRRLEQARREGVHGEFGIGLLGFWSLGEDIRVTSHGRDGNLYEMHMRRGDPRFTVRPSRGKIPYPGTEVTILPLHDSVKKVVNGEKLDRYLAAELRDRLKNQGIHVAISDKVSRRSYTVRPREFEGERLAEFRQVPVAGGGSLSVELYYRVPSNGDILTVGIFRDGTRVKRDILELEGFDRPPWTSNRLEGVIDYPALNVSPGTREGVVPDEQYAAFLEAVRSIEPALAEQIQRRESAEAERASGTIMKDIQKALTDALRRLPDHEYHWFDVGSLPERAADGVTPGAGATPENVLFPERPGPLAAVRIIPSRARIPPNGERILAAKASDAGGIPILQDIVYRWAVVSGPGEIADAPADRVRLRATSDVGEIVVEVVAQQETLECRARAVARIEERAPIVGGEGESREGLPSYGLSHHPGEPWRSRYLAEKNLIEINSGHRDYLAARDRVKNLRRYIGKLYAKEIVLINFPELPPAPAMERMVELLTRMEEKL